MASYRNDIGRQDFILSLSIVFTSLFLADRFIIIGTIILKGEFAINFL